jgi:formylglycine-generating enzyme required for sulfatase activity
MTGAALLLALLADAPAAPAAKDRQGQVRLGAAAYQPVKGTRIKVAPFALDADEVSRELYDECVSAGKCAALTAADKYRKAPVRNVSFNEAAAYCAFRGRRLPTESEWLRAAFPAARKQTGFGPAGLAREEGEVCPNFVVAGYDGDSCPEDRVTSDGKVVRTDGWPEDTQHRVVPAGSFVAATQKPGAVVSPRRDITYPEGAPVFHLFGNVAEWVVPDPGIPADGRALIRGGSFRRTRGLSITDRDPAPRDARYEDVGFRCARDLPSGQPAAQGSKR